MTFLPIVERELRVAARKKGTHWLWFFAAVAAIGTFFGVMIIMEGVSAMMRFGRVFFICASVLGFGFALVAGMILTSDCLCSEKRDGTLGLLFLTDLRGYDVVLGKLAATSMVSVYALLAIFPVLGLAIPMGGVSGAEFARMVLVLLVTLFLSLATGMLASALSRDTRAAMLLSFGTMLVLTGLLYLLTFAASWFFPASSAGWLLSPSPLTSFIHAFDTLYKPGMGAAKYWVSILSMFGMSAAFLSITSFHLPRSWQEGSGKEASSTKTTRVASRHSAESRSTNPFAWLCDRERFPGNTMRRIFGVLFVIWVMFFLGASVPALGRNQEFFIMSFIVAFCLHMVVKGSMAVQATRSLCEGRQSGGLELLLSTRLSPGEIISGQWHSLRRQFRPLLLILTMMNIATIWLAVFFRPPTMGASFAWILSSFLVGGILLLWVDFIAIGWMGMWAALRGFRPHRAVLNTLSRILGPPWLVLLFFLAVPIFSNRFSLEATLVCWMFWLAVSVVSAHLAFVDRKRVVQNSFRLLVVGEKLEHAVEPSAPWSPEWENRGAETQSSTPTSTPMTETTR